jgi:hypothetical protein
MKSQSLVQKRQASSQDKSSHNGIPFIDVVESGDMSIIQVPIEAIDIVERPQVGKEFAKIFYNPRSISSFTPERMNELQYSIRLDGLQQPPIVRASIKNDKYVKIELIAGERRLRSIQSIVDQDLPCFAGSLAEKPEIFQKDDIVIYKSRFGKVVKQLEGVVVVDFDEDQIGSKERKNCDYKKVNPTMSGSDLYQFVTCKVDNDCSDEKALRLAFNENEQSESLTIAEEIALVERLEKSYKQEEIADMLGTNISWVSTTSRFKSNLPKEAFEKLINGSMVRHVATMLMSYEAEDREEIFHEIVEQEEKETIQKIQTLKNQKEELLDDEEIQFVDGQRAKEKGKLLDAKKLFGKSRSTAKKVKKIDEKIKEVDDNAGIIKQSHVKKAEIKTGIKPKKAKMLDKSDIELYFLEVMSSCAQRDTTDDETGEIIPKHLADVVYRAVKAILEGNRDALSVIREHMYENGSWKPFDTAATIAETEDSDEDELEDGEDECSECGEIECECEDGDGEECEDGDGEEGEDGDGEEGEDGEEDQDSDNE